MALERVPSKRTDRDIDEAVRVFSSYGVTVRELSSHAGLRRFSLNSQEVTGWQMVELAVTLEVKEELEEERANTVSAHTMRPSF